MVVGNLHKEDDFLEVTHSFPVIEEIDHVTVDQSKFDFESILCGFTSKDLTLDMRVFPTNCDGSFTAKYFSQKFGEGQLVFNGQEKQFNQEEFPIQIKEFVLVEDAHTAVARGCLSEAQLIEEEDGETEEKSN